MTDAGQKSVIVIGAGPGGYAAAFAAADQGMNVTLIDSEKNPGGVCLFRGCIPSKSLLHVAKLLNETKHAANWGIEYKQPTIHIDKLRSWKDSVVEKMTGGLGVLSRSRNINYIQGMASFLDSGLLQVQRTEGGGIEKIAFDHVILATGSRPSTLPNMPDSPRILNSTTALELQDIPASMLVIGGGYIGLELGTVYAALGTKVTVVEMAPALLPGADQDLVSILHRKMEKTLHAILLGTTVASLKEEKNGLRVRFEGPNLTEPEQVFEKVLVSVGRKPNSSGLGLESAGIGVDPRGFVIVDPARRTSNPKVYAIGDVAGNPMLAHKASHEARVAVESIAGHNVAFEPRAIPAVVFTDPEIAWCGITELEARQQQRAVKVARFPWGASGRATTMDAPEGVTKLIVDQETERVLGVGICGSGAGELIAEGVLAVEMGANVSDMKMSIHPHPTLSETIMESAEVFFGQSTHIYRPKK